MTDTNICSLKESIWLNLPKVYQQLTKYDFKYGILEERDITMKTTKRIFAMITALVLCLAPMALMIGAADATANTGSYCSKCGTNNVYTTSPNTIMGDKIYLHTRDFCFERPMLTSVTKCHNCGRMYEEIITYRKFGHVDVYQNPANGRWTCYECGYQIY